MLVRGVVHHQFGDDPHAACMGRGNEASDIGQRAVVRMDAAVVADVVAVVAARRGIERQQPDRVDAKIGDVVELGDQAGKIAYAIVVGVEERLDVKLIDDRVLVPQTVFAQGDTVRGPVGEATATPSWRSRRRYLPDGERQIVRIEAYVLALASPDEAMTAHQVGGRQRCVVRQAPTPITESRSPPPARCADRG